MCRHDDRSMGMRNFPLRQPRGEHAGLDLPTLIRFQSLAVISVGRNHLTFGGFLSTSRRKRTPG